MTKTQSEDSCLSQNYNYLIGKFFREISFPMCLFNSNHESRFRVNNSWYCEQLLKAAEAVFVQDIPKRGIIWKHEVIGSLLELQYMQIENIKKRNQNLLALNTNTNEKVPFLCFV